MNVTTATVVVGVAAMLTIGFAAALGTTRRRIEKRLALIERQLQLALHLLGTPPDVPPQPQPAHPMPPSSQRQFAPPPPSPPELGDVVALMAQGRKIQAIKVYRERTGVGLKQAKDAVEELARRRGIPA
jgi:transposase InsO family protein